MARSTFSVRRPGTAPVTALALALALALAFAGLGSVTQPAGADTAPQDPNDPTTPTTVSIDPLPTPQINGVVWDTLVVGNTVYAGGSFSNARPAGSSSGQNTVPRGNLVAFDINTGAMTSFAPSFNGQIRAMAVSPDQTRLYVAGEFTTVNGTSRRRIAAFNLANGSLVSSFAPPVNYDVDAVVATNTTVYAGGSFLGVGSQDRQYLAAFSASNGALLDWAPQATGGTVNALAINPQGTRIAVGGSFTALNGSSDPGYGLAMVDATTGASLPMAVNSVVRNATADGAITSLSTDGTYIYGGGYTFGKSGGTWEGTFSAKWDGTINYLNDCHGDTYDATAIGEVVYSVGHSHYCENLDGVRQGAGGVGDYPYYRGIATTRTPTGTLSWEPDQGRYYSFLGQPAPTMLGWYPNLNAGSYTGQYQGPWSVDGNSDYLVMGGEFTRVEGVAQQGLVRFAVSGKAPNTRGPELFNASWPLNVSSSEAGTVRVNWSTNRDDDNEYLTYRVYRDTQNAAGLVETRSAASRFWNPSTMGVTDSHSSLTPGSTHQYRVQVRDPFGNVANSPWTTVTVAPNGARNSDYVEAVYDSQPTHWWRLGESSGTTSGDRVGPSPLTSQAGVTRGAAGAISGDSDGATTFSGASGGSAATTTPGNPPDVFSMEAWFRTTTTRGGRLVGWGNRNTASTSSKHDRQIYMDNAGRLHFGVKPTNQRLDVTSTQAYNDGAWHHAVATLSPTGMRLYVDGAQVAQRADVTVGEHLSIGYWRLGGDTVSGWPSAPSSGYFAGSLDEVAIYKHQLSALEVAAHHAAATGQEVPNVDPVAQLGYQVSGLTASFSSAGSADPDGSIASYAWTFGDGATSSAPNPTHTYAAAGTYGVTLTVTDDDGATDSTTSEVTVAAPEPTPNEAPEAVFTASGNGLTVTASGTSSSDPDGAIASYAWTFGDGATGSGATTSHTYAAAGTYDVTLTVTDDDGATDSVTQPVTVSAGAVPFAQDTFTRNVTGGWGAADLGGTWSRSGSGANFAVTGGVGTIRMGSKGAGPSMALPGGSSSDTEMRTVIGIDKAATGGGVYVTLRPRMVGGDRYYADTRFLSNGSMSLILGRNVGSSETVLQSRTVTGVTAAPGDRFQVVAQAVGTSPTTFRAKLWKVGTPEPSSWTASVTDSAAALQVSGSIGVGTYLSGSATNAPVFASFDDIWAGPTP